MVDIYVDVLSRTCDRSAFIRVGIYIERVEDGDHSRFKNCVADRTAADLRARARRCRRHRDDPVSGCVSCRGERLGLKRRAANGTFLHTRTGGSARRRGRSLPIARGVSRGSERCARLLGAAVGAVYYLVTGCRAGVRAHGDPVVPRRGDLYVGEFLAAYSTIRVLIARRRAGDAFALCHPLVSRGRDLFLDYVAADRALFLSESRLFAGGIFYDLPGAV